MTIRRALLVLSGATGLFAQNLQPNFEIAFAWQNVDRPWRGDSLTPDEDIKIVAVESILRSDPARGIPLVDKLLRNQQTSNAVRRRVLHVLSSNGSEEARQMVVRTAKDPTNPELQARAVQLLASRGGSPSEQVLAEVYAGTNNVDVKRQVIRSWSGPEIAERLSRIARTEKDSDLQQQAIRRLGELRATPQLAALYGQDIPTEAREAILRSLASANEWQRLVDIAKAEKNEELRRRAIQYAGVTRSSASTEALVQLYNSTSESSTRNAVLRALSHQGNAKQLIELARKESNPELKRAALQHITRMKGDDVTSFLAELLGN